MTAPTTGFPKGYKGRPRWGTPPELYEALDREFHFDLDAAADPELAKAPRYYTEEDDGLAQPWTGTVFCNPPYSACGPWVAKAKESADTGATVVMLLPARTDTAWFHDHIYGRAEIRFIRGRVKYVKPEGVTPNKDRYAGTLDAAAPFPSMICVWRPPCDLEGGNVEDLIGRLRHYGDTVPSFPYSQRLAREAADALDHQAEAFAWVRDRIGLTDDDEPCLRGFDSVIPEHLRDVLFKPSREAEAASGTGL